MNSNMRILRLSVDDQAREARNAQADYDTVRARRILETNAQRYLESKTASDREQAIKLFVATDEDIIAAAAQLRHAEYLRDRAVSVLEAAKDERRTAELDARNRRTAAYERLAIQRDKSDYPGVDQEDDDQIDDMGIGAIVNALDRLANNKHEQYHDVAREMVNAYNDGMAERVNGAGEYEEDDDQVSYRGVSGGLTYPDVADDMPW